MTKDQKSRFDTMYVSLAERCTSEALDAFWERATSKFPSLEGGTAQELKGDTATDFLAFVEAEAATISGS